MASNQPIKNKKNYQNPWGNNKKENIFEHNVEKNISNNNKGIKSYLNKINDNLNRLNENNKKNNKKNFSKYFILIVLIIILGIWGFSGFYIIKGAEQGVVTRLGKFSHLVYPGLNWKPNFFDEVIPVNIKRVRELTSSGMMLTAGENVVRVEMNVQYRVTVPHKYLFNVTNPEKSLRQATDSALSEVIGRYTMDRILTEGRNIIRRDTQNELEKMIQPYDMGITLLDVNFQEARPPKEVRAAFDDVIAARENEQQYIREAEAYSNEVLPQAAGQAQRILEEARAYKTQIVLESKGEVARFAKILPEYKLAPEITRKRLYIETMEKALKNSDKIIIDSNKNDLMVLPLEKIIRKTVNCGSKNSKKENPLLTSNHRTQKKSRHQKSRNSINLPDYQS